MDQTPSLMERRDLAERYYRAAAEAGVRLSSSLDLETVYQTAVSWMIEGFDGLLAQLWLCDSNSEILQLQATAAYRPDQPGGVKIEICTGADNESLVVSGRVSQDQPDAGINHWVSQDQPDTAINHAQSRQPGILIRDDPHLAAVAARTHRRQLCNDLASRREFQSELRQHESISVGLFHPLLVNNELQGVLAYFGTGEKPEDVAPVLDIFGSLAAYAIHNARLIRREEQARHVAERAARGKTGLLRMVSHELRTPLTTLQLQIQLTQRNRETELTPRQHESLRKMASAASRLLEMVDSLLEYARIESGGASTHPEFIELGVLVGEVFEEFKLQAEQKGLQFSLNVPPQLPPLFTDRRLTRLILINLIVNAIKYTDRGSVGVHLEYAHNKHRVSVSDTGPGIPPENQSLIFEPFEQLETGARKHIPGVGLGLSLVREMVRAIGGAITLESMVGAGSTFVVTLPAMAASPVHPCNNFG